MGSQIVGNSTFPLCPNPSIKYNKTRILQAILPPGLPVANCIIISVPDCHLLPPSQGLGHNKKCSFLVRRLLTSSRAECLIKSQDETFTWVFTGSSERAKAGGFNTSCCKLVQIQLRIQPVRENWTHRQWDIALLDIVQLKRQITKKGRPRGQKVFKAKYLL